MYARRAEHRGRDAVLAFRETMVDETKRRAASPSCQFEDSILRSLRRIMRATDLHSRRLERDFSLTGPQVVCLRHLLRSGPCTAGELAREVSLSQATISGILERLERRGALQRERDERDRRRVHCRLTGYGRELVERVPSPLQERFVDQLNELPPENQAIIDITLRQIVRMMEAEDLEAAL